MARLLVLAAVLLCALPAAAHAQSFSVPTQMRDVNFRPGIGDVTPEGPAVAGDSVVWWEHRGDRAFLVIASAKSEPRDVLSVPARRGPQLRVAASGNRAIAQRRNSFYDVDVPSGEARRMDSCFGGAACSSCRDQSGSSEFEFERVGTVLAMRAVLSLRRSGRRVVGTNELPAIHMPAGTTDRRWLNITDPRKLRSVKRAPRPLHLQELRTPQGHHA